MNASSPGPRIFRFAPFEFDPQSGELRRGGAGVKLQKQPADLLAMLLERPGEVVTREDLQTRLWPGQVAGDFDVGLNKAVRRLREALEDSAQEPSYIETLPQHGYRFIAPVTVTRPGAVRRRTRYYAIAVGGGLAALLLAAYLLGGYLRKPVAPAQIRSVAVLPFANLSGDPGQEYFADGLTDSLITELGSLSALRVISRQSTLRYKKGDRPLPEIARELEVDALLEGTVVRAGGRVRITAQLLRASPEQHLWAQSYELSLADILAVQREIAASVANHVKASLLPAEQSRPARPRRINPEAYEAYLRGQYFFYGYTLENFQKAIDSLESAVEIDPGFAQAWAMLSTAYGAQAYWGGVRHAEVRAKAKAAARKAVELDENLADAHCHVATAAALGDWDWATAEREYKRAIELNPSHVASHASYGMLLVSLRRHAEAMEQFQWARRIDPLHPIRGTHVAMGYYLSGQFQKAADQLRHTIEVAPDFFLARRMNWRVLHRLGEDAAALAECRRGFELFGDAEAAQALDQGGRLSGYAAAMKAAALTLERRARTQYVVGSEVARLYAHAGEKDRALVWLETAFSERDPLMHLLWAEPEWEALYSEPRFRELLRKMGFPSFEKSAAWSGTAR